MPRPFKFPDPNDRSFNEPRVIAQPEDILKLYNKEKGTKQEKVTGTVRDWFVNEAKNYGWDTAEFTGSQCTLGVEGLRDLHEKQEDD